MSQEKVMGYFRNGSIILLQSQGDRGGRESRMNCSRIVYFC